VRSDIYSLGLVMREMFAEKDLDPAVDRVIQRCLDEDPKLRPGSAISVAMALPGGDPLAAAMAAGETPSPEMVAAAGKHDGIGIKTEYREVIFGIFKRLHTNDKYSGTGMGLAISRSIIESHGGRLWAVDNPPRGASFYFTLPTQVEAH
jgi:hypothetical protein